MDSLIHFFFEMLVFIHIYFALISYYLNNNSNEKRALSQQLKDFKKAQRPNISQIDLHSGRMEATIDRGASKDTQQDVF